LELRQITASFARRFPTIAHLKKRSKNMKKNAEQIALTFIKNPDILAWAAAHKNEQIVMGFALENQ